MTFFYQLGVHVKVWYHNVHSPMQNSVIFSGNIGRGWAMLFAAAGYEVKLYDAEMQVVAAALDDILVQLKSISNVGMLRGQLSVTEQHRRITGAQSLADCVSDAFYIQVWIFIFYLFIFFISNPAWLIFTKSSRKMRWQLRCNKKLSFGFWTFSGVRGRWSFTFRFGPSFTKCNMPAKWINFGRVVSLYQTLKTARKSVNGRSIYLCAFGAFLPRDAYA